MKILEMGEHTLGIEAGKPTPERGFAANSPTTKAEPLNGTLLWERPNEIRLLRASQL